MCQHHLSMMIWEYITQISCTCNDTMNIMILMIMVIKKLSYLQWFWWLWWSRNYYILQPCNPVFPNKLHSNSKTIGSPEKDQLSFVVIVIIMVIGDERQDDANDDFYDDLKIGMIMIFMTWQWRPSDPMEKNDLQSMSWWSWKWRWSNWRPTAIYFLWLFSSGDFYHYDIYDGGDYYDDDEQSFKVFFMPM